MMDDSGFDWEAEMNYIIEKGTRGQTAETKTRGFDISLKRPEGPKAF